MTKPWSAWLGLLCLALGGCSTYTSYQGHAPNGPSTPSDYPIQVYAPDRQPPRPCIWLGEISVRHTPWTVLGGRIDEEMLKIMNQAHARGADAVQLLTVQKPGFGTSSFAVHARLLRYADAWETVPLSEAQFVKYLQSHRASLDPIEGIWTDGLPHRLGIIRDASKPGRDFVAFTLTPDAASWRAGYKKMDLARDTAPDSYQITYFKDDFSATDLIVRLEQNDRFQFILSAGDQSYPVTFNKLVPSPATP